MKGQHWWARNLDDTARVLVTRVSSNSVLVAATMHAERLGMRTIASPTSSESYLVDNFGLERARLIQRLPRPELAGSLEEAHAIARRWITDHRLVNG